MIKGPSLWKVPSEILKWVRERALSHLVAVLIRLRNRKREREREKAAKTTCGTWVGKSATGMTLEDHTGQERQSQSQDIDL